jgi:hypothetical protein
MYVNSVYYNPPIPNFYFSTSDPKLITPSAYEAEVRRQSTVDLCKITKLLPFTRNVNGMVCVPYFTV